MIFPLRLTTFEHVLHSDCVPFSPTCRQSHHFLCKLWPSWQSSATFAFSPFPLINVFWPLINFYSTHWTSALCWVPYSLSWHDDIPKSPISLLKGSQLLMAEPWHITFCTSLFTPSLPLTTAFIHSTPCSAQYPIWYCLNLMHSLELFHFHCIMVLLLLLGITHCWCF